MRAARRKTGIAAFERRCRLTSYNNRQCKAWKVPGTAEHGHHAMLQRYTMFEYGRLLAQGETND